MGKVVGKGIVRSLVPERHHRPAQLVEPLEDAEQNCPHAENVRAAAVDRVRAALAVRHPHQDDGVWTVRCGRVQSTADERCERRELILRGRSRPVAVRPLHRKIARVVLVEVALVATVSVVARCVRHERVDGRWVVQQRRRIGDPVLLAGELRTLPGQELLAPPRQIDQQRRATRRREALEVLEVVPRVRHARAASLQDLRVLQQLAADVPNQAGLEVRAVLQHLDVLVQLEAEAQRVLRLEAERHRLRVDIEADDLDNLRRPLVLGVHRREPRLAEGVLDGRQVARARVARGTRREEIVDHGRNRCPARPHVGTELSRERPRHIRQGRKAEGGRVELPRLALPDEAEVFANRRREAVLQEIRLDVSHRHPAARRDVLDDGVDVDKAEALRWLHVGAVHAGARQVENETRLGRVQPGGDERRVRELERRVGTDRDAADRPRKLLLRPGDRDAECAPRDDVRVLHLGDEPFRVQFRDLGVNEARVVVGRLGVTVPSRRLVDPGGDAAVDLRWVDTVRDAPAQVVEGAAWLRVACGSAGDAAVQVHPRQGLGVEAVGAFRQRRGAGAQEEVLEGRDVHRVNPGVRGPPQALLHLLALLAAQSRQREGRR